MRFKFDKKKSLALRKNPTRSIGFEEAQEIFRHPCGLLPRKNKDFMRKTSKTKRPISAESIARLADKGEDISAYFTNSGKMMRPFEAEKTHFVKDKSSVVSKSLTNYRKCTRELMDRVHRMDLVYEFFFVFPGSIMPSRQRTT